MGVCKKVPCCGSCGRARRLRTFGSDPGSDPGLLSWPRPGLGVGILGQWRRELELLLLLRLLLLLLLKARQVGNDLGQLLPLLCDPLPEVAHLCCSLGPGGLYLLQVHSHLIHFHCMLPLGLFLLEL